MGEPVLTQHDQDGLRQRHTVRAARTGGTPVRDGIAILAVGDVSVIQDGIDFGRKPNQKISQWPHGQFVGCVAYKAREYGIAVEQIPEDYSTRTCSYCRMVLERALRGRKLICPVCDALIHRGTNVAANIFSRTRFGEYAQFQVRLT